MNVKGRLEKPLVPDLPKNVVLILKPDKTVVIENQHLRFGKKLKNIFIFVCFIVFDIIHTVYFTLLTVVDLVFFTSRIMNIICIMLWKMFPNLP